MARAPVAASVPETPPDAAPVTAPVIDLSAVSDQFDGDLDLYREILLTTLDEVRALRDRLAAGIGTLSDSDLVRQIHALKGVCLNLCFARAGAQAAALERALRSGGLSAEPLNAALQDFLVVLDQAVAAADAHLAAASAS